MKISFIIPAYNEAAVIGKCVGSIVESLAQNEGIESEIIVVDNNSTDSTAAIAGSFAGVTVVREVRKGVVFARQAGFEAATGDLIANVDADTMLPPLWLPTVVQRFSTDANLVALTGPHIYYDSPMYIRAIVKVWFLVGFCVDALASMFTGTHTLFQGGNYVVRREALLQIHGYDTSILFYGEDVDTGKRLGAIGKVTWTFAFPIYASGRRVMKNGLLRTGYLYGMSYIWVSLFGKPYTQTYNDIRLDQIQ